MNASHSVYFRFSLLLFLLASNLAMSKKVATSQPVEIKYPITHCSEWKIDQGTEGECSLQTKATTWKLRHFRVGKEDRDKKGRIKNLIVILHPFGNTHRVFEYWGKWLGPGKVIDTDKWHVLALSNLGDGLPKDGSPILITIDEIIETQRGVIDFLFPNSKFILGGGSMGGRLSLLWAQRYSKRIKKLFVLGATDVTSEPQRKIIQEASNLQLKEMELGPYEFWKKEDKYAWFSKDLPGYIPLVYTDDFFKSPERFVEQGGKREDYKGPKEFLKFLLHGWTSYFIQWIHPKWIAAQVKSVDNAYIQLKVKDIKKMPKKIFIMKNPRDRLFKKGDYDRFESKLKQAKRKVYAVTVDDDRGHIACCEGKPPEPVKKGLKEFLEDF